MELHKPENPVNLRDPLTNTNENVISLRSYPSGIAISRYAVLVSFIALNQYVVEFRGE